MGDWEGKKGEGAFEKMQNRQISRRGRAAILEKLIFPVDFFVEYYSKDVWQHNLRRLYRKPAEKG